MPPVIDVHTHFNTHKQQEWAHQLRFSGGAFGKMAPTLTADELDEQVRIHTELMDRYGIDVQLLSPSPVNMQHSQDPRIVRWFHEFYNDTLAKIVDRCPDRLVGVGSFAQAWGEPPEKWLGSLERCKELGFVGALVNPDPAEGTALVPNLADEFWYPVWEKLVELDLVGHIHPSSCQNRRAHFHEHYAMEETLAVTSLARSRVFDDFPSLRLMIAHGGGAVPLQFGRFSVLHLNFAEAYARTFEEGVRQMHYDLAVWGSQKALELIIDTYGVDRCLFATEAPGSGTGVHPVTGKMQDDLRPLIENVSYLGEEDRARIFRSNACDLFRLDRVPGPTARLGT